MGKENAIRLVTSNPALLRKDFAQLRAAMAGYISCLYKEEGYSKSFVQSVLSHSAAVLTPNYQRHIQRFKRIRQVTSKVPAWKPQVDEWDPKQVAVALQSSQWAVDRLCDIP